MFSLRGRPPHAKHELNWGPCRGLSSLTATDMRPSGQISTLATVPPPSMTLLAARLTSAFVNLAFDMMVTQY